MVGWMRGGGRDLRRLARRTAGRGVRLASGWTRRLPVGIRRSVRDRFQKALLRLGRAQVVPAGAFEDFLVDQLQRLREGSGVTRLEGDYLEFGVYVGTSMGAAVRAFDRAEVAPCRFFGFDSFGGLPAGSETDGWTSGAYAASRQVAEWNLARQDVLGRVELIEGWFDETCTVETVDRHRLGDVLVAMIDCDTYTSSRLALDFVEPLLGPDALVIFDDWYARNPDGTQMEGQRRAFHEVLARRPELVVADVGRPGFYGQAFRLSTAPVPATDAAALS